MYCMYVCMRRVRQRWKATAFFCFGSGGVQDGQTRHGEAFPSLLLSSDSDSDSVLFWRYTSIDPHVLRFIHLAIFSLSLPTQCPQHHPLARQSPPSSPLPSLDKRQHSTTPPLFPTPKTKKKEPGLRLSLSLALGKSQPGNHTHGQATSHPGPITLTHHSNHSLTHSPTASSPSTARGTYNRPMSIPSLPRSKTSKTIE